MLPSEAWEVIRLLNDFSKVSNTLSQHRKIVYATQHYAKFCGVRDPNLKKMIKEIEKRHAKYLKFNRKNN